MLIFIFKYENKCLVTPLCFSFMLALITKGNNSVTVCLCLSCFFPPFIQQGTTYDLLFAIGDGALSKWSLLREGEFASLQEKILDKFTTILIVGEHKFGRAATPESTFVDFTI